MRSMACFGIVFLCASALGETADEAYARLTAYRSVWETNCWAYIKAIPLASEANASSANSRWFVDFLGFPDFAETNRCMDILQAKRYAIHNLGFHIGIQNSSNAWFAVADFIDHVRSHADPSWVGKSAYALDYSEEDEKDPAFYRGSNPNLDFNFYRKAHPDVDYRRWHVLVKERRIYEDSLARVQTDAMEDLRWHFWWNGTADYTDEQMDACRSTIIERAKLTPDQAKCIFESDDKMHDPLKRRVADYRRKKFGLSKYPCLTVPKAEVVRPLPTTDEEFKAEFLRLVASSNLLIRRPKEEIGPLCEGIAKLGDKDRALRLLDQLFEMAVAQEVTATEVRHRCSWFYRLFVVGGMAFCHAQKLRGNPSERWDKLFKFYDRFLDETTKAEEGLPMELEYSQWSESDRSKWSYLTALRSNLGSCNIIILDFYNRHLRKEDTRTLRDDVLERLLEFNKFSEATPFIPKSGKPLARPDFSRWRRSESPSRK